MVGNCIRKFGLSSFLGVFLLSFSLGSVTAKPLTPVSVQITPLNQHIPGQPTEFEVRATVTVNAQQLIIRIEPAAGMVLNSGKLFWSGVLAKGETKILKFSATLPHSGQQSLKAFATIHGPDGSQLSSSAVFNTGAAVFKATSKTKTNAAMRNGRRIEEHSLER